MSNCCPQSDLLLDKLGLRWAIVALNLFLDMLGLRWAIVAFNLIFFWTCWDSGEQLLPSIWSLTGHAGTEVSDCCLQSDLFLDMLGLRWAIDALNLIFFWTCWDSGERLLPLIVSLTWHARTEVSDCCSQSDLFLDMLGLRWAIVALNLIFFWTCWGWGGRLFP